MLCLGRLLALENVYRGEALEDDMVGLYPSCSFAGNTVAASIDTPLHGYLPFDHVDHLHPDWAIAMAASRNGKQKMEEFNKRYNHKLVWLPWQRPGFELGLMLRKAVEDNPGCDGIILGSHGLFTWGDTQRESYLNSVTVIDQLGECVLEHAAGKTQFGASPGGASWRQAHVEEDPHRESWRDRLPRGRNGTPPGPAHGGRLFGCRRACPACAGL